MWSNTSAGDGKSWCMIFYTTFVRVQTNDSDVTRCCLRELEIRFVQFSFNRIFVICFKSKDPESPPGSLMIHSVLQTFFLSYVTIGKSRITLLEMTIPLCFAFFDESISIKRQFLYENRPVRRTDRDQVNLGQSDLGQRRRPDWKTFVWTNRSWSTLVRSSYNKPS